MIQKLLSRTHFRRKSTENLGWQWFWTTKSANNVDTVGVGAEGYDQLRGALNGFFSQQGIPEWEPRDREDEAYLVPENYVLHKISDDHWVVTKFRDEELETNQEKKD